MRYLRTKVFDFMTLALPAMQKCLVWLLKPVVRFSLKHALKLQDITECAKVEFVNQASEIIHRADGKVTDSRISVMTGLHRRDVQRIRAGTGEREEHHSLVAKVLGQWQSDPRFLTKAGKPKALESGFEGAQFNDLVASVSRELNPATVLFELERVKAVVRDKKLVKFELGQYSPKGDLDGIFKIYAADSTDLLDAVEENAFAGSEIPNLHCRTEYDRVRAENVPKIKAWLLREGHLLHEKARKFLASFDQDINPKLKFQGKFVRVSLSSFGKISS